MATYHIIKNYSSSGKIGIAPYVFADIVTILLQEEGIELYRNNNIIRIKQAINVTITNERTYLNVTLAKKLEKEESEIYARRLESTILDLTEVPTTINFN